MNRRRASNLTFQSDWQTERAIRLDRKFHFVDKAIARGLTFKQAVRQFEWFWRHRNYRSDRTRKVKFGYGTLRRLWIKWRKGGRTPAALRLHYRSGYQRAPQKFLLEFVDYCSAPHSLSLLATWKKFVARRKLAPPVTYSSILRYFNSAQYRGIQGNLRQIARAQAALPQQIASAKRTIRAHYQKGQGSAAL